MPGVDVRLAPPELARFVYSDAYELFEDQARRRDVLLEVGRRGFGTILGTGIGGSEGLTKVGEAAAGGHLRFSSFDQDEQRALTASGVSGDLAPVEGDSLLVTAQNFGSGRDQGTKLDYWTRRSVRHSCRIEEGAPATCRTEVSLANEAPEGLTEYVAGVPYGLLRSYVEVYVPEEARVTSVQRDGSPVEFRAEPQAGREAIGVFVKVPAGETSSVGVAYELPKGDDYELQALPQPLAADATIELSLTLPDGWAIEGTDLEQHGRTARYEGPFDRRLEVRAGPSERTGLAALWEGVRQFWRDPSSSALSFCSAAGLGPMNLGRNAYGLWHLFPGQWSLRPLMGEGFSPESQKRCPFRQELGSGGRITAW